MTKKIVILALAVLIIPVSLTASPLSANGRLKVVGLQLSGECGDPVQLRGISTHGIQWYWQCYDYPAAVDFIANTMNADLIRIAMYVGSAESWITNPAEYEARIDYLVNAAEARGIYAIIDWHVLTPGDPNALIDQAKVFWAVMAQKYKEKKHVLYEICNEPNGGAVNWAVIKNYADTIIPIIRAIDPNTVIIVGTPNWSQLGGSVVSNQLSYPNIMYAFHFYAGTHSIDMLYPYVGQIPIFCSEWGASLSSGDGGLNTANANNFINVMDGTDTVHNPTGVKISWAAWSFADKNESSAQLKPTITTTPGIYTNVCGQPAPVLKTAVLSAAGAYVREKIMNPARQFTQCNPTSTPSFTPTITGTPPTETVTPTITETPTITQTHTALPSDKIYDGDTAGMTLADFQPLVFAATPGTITEQAAGNPGNAMRFYYLNPPGTQIHMVSFTAKTVGSFNHIEMDIKANSGSPVSLYFMPDVAAWSAYKRVDLVVAAGGITTSWKTVRVPLNSVYISVPSQIDIFRLVNRSTSTYSVLVDNIKLVMVPTPTCTPTRTQTSTQTVTKTVTATFTITETHTVSPTFTVTPTVTVTPTFVPQLVFKEHFTYPNPSKGDKIVFRYIHTGKVDKVRIRVFSYSDRKIADFEDSAPYKYGEPGASETEWTPPWQLGNGLYYYILELTGMDKTVVKKQGAFVVLRQLY